MRLNIIRRIIVVLFLLIAGYLFNLQVMRGQYFARLSQSNSMRVVPFEGARGRIYDRNGKILADNIKAFHAVVIPQDIGNNKALFAFIASLVGTEPSVIERRYFRNKLNPFSPVVIAESLTRAQAIKIEENAFRFPGLMVVEQFSRIYHSPENNSHLIGYVGKIDPSRAQAQPEYGYSSQELVGYSGVEEYYDGVLRGIPGGRRIEVNSRGRQTQLLSVREPVDGKSIVLTIDDDMQAAGRAVLAGRRGALVVMDPANGEVLALVSSPSFDPNAFMDKERHEKVLEYLRNPDAPMLNRAVAGAFQPGSVFKIIVALGALEDFKIKSGTIFDCPGYFQMGGRTYNFPHAWGAQDLKSALAHSANEYFFHSGLLLGTPAMVKHASAFGLGSRTGIDLPYEVKGNLPNSKSMPWFKGDTLNTSIGQGYVLATPIQLARLMAAVENNGKMPQPYILLNRPGEVSFRQDNGGIAEVAPLPPPPMTHVSFRKEVWDAVREGLKGVVNYESGTAHALAAIPGVTTYGKTGTAQTGPGREDHAWFAGVSKTDKREIVYCLLLEHGGSSANAVGAVHEFLLSLKAQGKI